MWNSRGFRYTIQRKNTGRGMKILDIDIETYCELDLQKVGVYAYTEHPSFRILTASYAVDNGDVRITTDEDEIRNIPGLWDYAVTKSAHNANFERICFSRLAGLPTGEYLPPESWLDTQGMAANWGYPQKLEYLAEALGVEHKDSAGTRLINLFSKPNPRTGLRIKPEDKPEEWKQFKAYNTQDVVVLKQVRQALMRLHGGFAPGERAVWNADARLNDRGITTDTTLAAAASDANQDVKNEALAKIKMLTGVDNPNSRNQLLAWLNEQPHEDLQSLQDVKADTVKDLLQVKDLPPDARRALELRQDTSLTTASKYDAAIRRRSDDGRLRGSFKYFGAHTGRWSGQGVQLQNLARDSAKTDEEAIDLATRVIIGEPVTALDLKKLVRSMFLGPFTVCDYSAIEARVLAWLAGEQWVLDAFRAGRDIYIETASRMFGVDYEAARALRQKGKVAVLALGYGGGLVSMRAMGADGSDDEVKMHIQQWRAANPNIVRFWKILDNAFRAGGGRVGEYVSVRKDVQSRQMQIVLPSGRAVCYREPRVIRAEKFGEMRDVLSFIDPKYRNRVQTYGGKLTENVTQAVARDLLAHALVEMDALGVPAVAHVHDEILVDGGNVETVAAIMGEDENFRPAWADGLPLSAEGYNCKRYRKG
nr:MAG TPA: DNA polymerase I [Caudoviricetes sp.]